MSTESEVKLARYQQVEKEADGFGRVIGVRRLKPSEQTKLAGMTAELTGSDQVLAKDPDTGEEKLVTIQHRYPLIVAGSVSLIDEAHIPFPRNRGELDAIYDKLDVEGLIAASAAMARLVKDEVIADPVGTAKNS